VVTTAIAASVVTILERGGISMDKRPLLVLLAAAAGIITYYAALIPGLENTWRQLAAAIAVAIMLAVCLQLFAGKPKAGFR
jgi:hypothetical protein